MVFICLLSAFACVGMHVFKWTQQLNKAVLLRFFIIFIYSFVVCVFVVVDVCFVVVVFGGMVITQYSVGFFIWIQTVSL